MPIPKQEDSTVFIADFVDAMNSLQRIGGVVQWIAPADSELYREGEAYFVSDFTFNMTNGLAWMDASILNHTMDYQGRRMFDQLQPWTFRVQFPDKTKVTPVEPAT